MYYLKIYSSNNKQLDVFILFVKKLLSHTQTQFRFIKLPTKKKRLNLLRSPHVYKKSQEHFEINTFKGCFIINQKYKPQLLSILSINKSELIKIKISTIKGGSLTR